MDGGLEEEVKENQPAAETASDRKKKRGRRAILAVNGVNRGGNPRSFPPSPRAQNHQARVWAPAPNEPRLRRNEEIRRSFSTKPGGEFCTRSVKLGEQTKEPNTRKLHPGMLVWVGIPNTPLESLNSQCPWRMVLQTKGYISSTKSLFVTA